jgi:ribonuclease PH
MYIYLITFTEFSRGILQMTIRRFLERKANEVRDVTIKVNYNPYAEGSCLVKFGHTHIICTASVDESVPPFLRGKGKGWITAEYGMIPRSTHSRMRREASSRQQNGRTQEIQRLIGRSLRSVVDLKKLGERQIIIDCDVLQADGGTRTAAITGGYVALVTAINHLIASKKIKNNPIINQIAAISCGILNDQALVDLDYAEDSRAEVDANFVMTIDGKLVELQSTAEGAPFTREQFSDMLDLSSQAIEKLIVLQSNAIENYAQNSSKKSTDAVS